MHITQIPSEATLRLRNEILRPGKDLSECIFEGDDAPKTRHFGAIDEEDTIVAIVSVYQNGNPLIDTNDAYQLRAMATSLSCRGQGVGQLLLKSAESYAKSQGSTLIWANARSHAVGFYTKSGYRLASDPFLINGIGTHYLVTKALDSLDL